MKYLILTVLLATVHIVSSQIDGGFWWLTKKPQTTAPPKPTAQVDGRYQSTTKGYPPSGQKRCECVPYFQCNDGEIVTDGAGIISIRFGPNKEETRRVGENCNDNLEICCDNPNKPTPYPQTTKPSGQLTCECVPYHQCNDGEIITDGAGIIGIRVGPNKSEIRRVGENCQNILDICCDHPSKPTPSPQTTKPYQQTTKPYRPSGQQRCECVPYYQCKDGEIITDGEGIIDIRVGPNKNNTKRVGGNCKDILDVCCDGPNKPTPLPPTPRPSPPPYTDAQCGITLDTGDPFDIDIRIHLNKSIHGFDGVAPFAMYPWMAALLTPNPRNPMKPIYKCGGSLIHPRVILTVAHCVERISPSQLTVRLGEWDTQKERDHEIYLHQDYYVTDIILHDQYVIGTTKLFDDIALVFLEEEAQLDHHINTVCLPQPGQEFIGQRCYATGWGRDNFGEKGVWQAILKEVDLPVIEPHTCQNQFKANRRLGCRFCLHDTFLCAGGEAGKDTCQGDGGSPLVCFNNGVAVQAGMVAWGIGCGNTIPAAYVDVSRYVHWIDYTVSSYLQEISTFKYQWQQPYTYEGSAGYDECTNNLFNAAYNKLPRRHPCRGWQRRG